MGTLTSNRGPRRFRDYEISDVIEAGGATLYVLRDLKKLDLSPRAAGFAAVLSGHSHRPAQEVRDVVLYFNPGSAGPRRFRQPVSVGKLVILDGKVRSAVFALAA